MEPGAYLPYIMISIGGIAGANLRYVTSLWFASQFGSHFPYGTLFINVTGSLILGLFLGIATERLTLDPNYRFLIATGFCGAFTTFSTFSAEILILLQAARYIEAALYASASVLLGIAAVALGILLARIILP